MLRIWKRQHKESEGNYNGKPHAQQLGIKAVWNALPSELQQKILMSDEISEDGTVTLVKAVMRDDHAIAEPFCSIAVDGTIRSITWVTPKSWRK